MLRRFSTMVMILLFGFCQEKTLAAGGRTHAEMGQRIWQEHFQQMEERLPGLETFFDSTDVRRAFYSGCYFPDWGYAGIHHDASEDSHWNDFHQAYFQVLQEQCSWPWTLEDRMRIAFFFGLIVHGITDIPWHFDGGTHKSLLTMEWEIDGKPHEVETSLEFLAHHLFSIEPSMTADMFWWPYEDMLSAYERREELDVKREQLEKGCKLLSTAWILSESIGKAAHARYEKEAPWGFQHMEDYYYGGIQHGGAASVMWISWYYARMMGWRFYQHMPIYGISPPQYVPYTGVQDLTLCEDLPTHNTGKEPLLEVGWNEQGQERRVLLRFALSDTKPNTIPRLASLWLYLAGKRDCPQGGDFILLAEPHDSPWQEGDGFTDDVDGFSGRPGQGEEASWIKTSQESAMERTTNAPKTLVKGSQDPGVWIHWDVTPWAQEWHKDPASNHGILLRRHETKGSEPGFLQFVSSQALKCQKDGYGGGTRCAYRPILILEP